MYIELKADGINGPARIGRMTFSKSGKTIYYRGRSLQSCAGHGFKCNYFDGETGEGYWISGCKKNGQDRLYPGAIIIDENVREEYWTTIRDEPGRKTIGSFAVPASMVERRTDSIAVSGEDVRFPLTWWSAMV